MSKFSANISMLFKEVPMLERIGLAKEAGFSGIEIQFPYEIPAEVWQTELLQHQMPLTLFNCGIGDMIQGGEGLACIPGKEDEFELALAQCKHYADLLKPSHINILSGKPNTDRDLDNCFDVFCHNLNKAVDTFTTSTVIPITELINPLDMKSFFLSDFEIWDRVKSAVPGIGLQFDVYHVSRIGEDVLTKLQQYQDDVAYVQFADHPGRHEPGTGDLDFPAIFTYLNSHYQGPVGAEYVPLKGTHNSLGWLSK